MAKRAERTRWVSYLRVSTVEQAEKELSLTAQRRSAEEFAAHHDAVIDHHYVEPGASGTDTHRAVFNEPLQLPQDAPWREEGLPRLSRARRRPGRHGARGDR